MSDNWAAEGDRRRAGKAGVGGAGCFGKAEGAEGGVVFGKLDPGLEFEGGEAQGTGAGWERSPCDRMSSKHVSVWRKL